MNQLASSLYASGSSLSRSVSSVGEHHSETYISPTLPKRAETFGGFDNANKDPGAINKGKELTFTFVPAYNASPTGTYFFCMWVALRNK